jgi:hypothetical protein
MKSPFFSLDSAFVREDRWSRSWSCSDLPRGWHHRVGCDPGSVFPGSFRLRAELALVPRDHGSGQGRTPSRSAEAFLAVPDTEANSSGFRMPTQTRLEMSPDATSAPPILLTLHRGESMFGGMRGAFGGHRTTDAVASSESAPVLIRRTSRLERGNGPHHVGFRGCRGDDLLIAETRLSRSRRRLFHARFRAKGFPGSFADRGDSEGLSSAYREPPCRDSSRGRANDMREWKPS